MVATQLKQFLRGTPLYPFSFRTYYQVKQWGTALEALRRRRLRSAALMRSYMQSESTPKLHIGSGEHTLPGWLNADIMPVRDDVCFLDATKRFPFANNGFAYLFSEHMIEHIPYQAGQSMIGECFRILRPGGRLRLSTPDLNFLFQLLSQEPSATQAAYIKWSVQRYWNLAEPRAALVINNFFYSWAHRFIYDEATLRHAMAQAGFQAIQRFEVGISDTPALQGLENEGRFPTGFVRLESLVLEGTKP